MAKAEVISCRESQVCGALDQEDLREFDCQAIDGALRGRVINHDDLERDIVSVAIDAVQTGPKVVGRVPID